MKSLFLFIIFSSQVCSAVSNQCTFEYFKENPDIRQFELSDKRLNHIEAMDRFDYLSESYPVHSHTDFTGEEYYREIRYKKILAVKDFVGRCAENFTVEIIFEEECIFSAYSSHAACRAFCTHKSWEDPDCDY